MPRHIGIVACSAEGAALCYRTIASEGSNLVGKHDHPEMTMHTIPLRRYMKHIEKGDWAGVAALMAQSAKALAAAGADFLICPDNTLHQAYETAVASTKLPWLHIAEVVASEAERRNFRRLGLLGTTYLMNGPVYPARLAARSISCALPDKIEQERINMIIFDELVLARFSDEARSHFVELIDRMRLQGCDAVVLGCTEIPILLEDTRTTIPTLDSTRLLARAALWRAVQP